MEKTENVKTEDVVVKVPTNEVNLLTDQSFFGKDREQWLTEAVHEAIIRELDKLALTDLERVRSLERQYGLSRFFRF